jgi:hypothetical protein
LRAVCYGRLGDEREADAGLVRKRVGKEKERGKGEIRSWRRVAILLLTVPSGQLTQVPSQFKAPGDLPALRGSSINWAGQPKRSKTGQGELQNCRGNGRKLAAGCCSGMC